MYDLNKSTIIQLGMKRLSLFEIAIVINNDKISYRSPDVVAEYIEKNRKQW